MRILHIGKYYPPHRGGIETAVAALAEAQARLGHSVTVLCAADSPAAARELVNNVRVIRLGCLGELFSQPILPLLPLAMMREAAAADVLHFHAPNPLAELFSFFLRKPVFVTFHADVVRQKGLLTAYRFLQNAFFRRAKRVFAGSLALTRTSSILQAFEKKVTVIPFGLDPSRFSGAAKAEAEGGRPYVLFVGRLVSYKGLPVLLEAMRDLDCELEIVGEGPMHQELEDLCKQLGCSARVHFRGLVEEEERMAQLFQGAAAVVLPSTTRAEAFGMVLIEAMGWGRPIVSTNLDTGVSEVNENGKTGLVVPAGDASALAAAIARLLADQDLSATFARNGREKFQTTYSSAVMAERTCGEYRQYGRDLP
jgi:glycosyltransferase involved in cell wall biosynthesis